MASRLPPISITNIYSLVVQNYTQNIDTLETLAGVRRVLQCHGSFATASCLNCRVRVNGTDIEDDILNQRVPLCKICSAAAPPVPAKKVKKQRRDSGWHSDESDEPDEPAYPPWIMKVRLVHRVPLTL